MCLICYNGPARWNCIQPLVQRWPPGRWVPHRGQRCDWPLLPWCLNCSYALLEQHLWHVWESVCMCTCVCFWWRGRGGPVWLAGSVWALCENGGYLTGEGGEPGVSLSCRLVWLLLVTLLDEIRGDRLSGLHVPLCRPPPLSHCCCAAHSRKVELKLEWGWKSVYTLLTKERRSCATLETLNGA